MGKTKIVEEKPARNASQSDAGGKEEGAKSPAKSSKKKITSGIVYVDATFNNTKVLFTDKLGNTVFWSTAGSLGFKGAKKGTPFAAGKIGDLIGGKMAGLGVKDTEVVVRGVGSGRESAVRAVLSHGIDVTSIKDATPVPHNGPKPKKPRRV